MTDHSYKAAPFVFLDDAPPALIKAQPDVGGPAGFWAGSALLVFVAYLLAQVLGGGLVGLVAGAAAGLSGVDLRDPAAFSRFTRDVAAPAAVAGTLLGGAAVWLLARRYAGPTMRDGFPHGLGLTWAPSGEIRLGCAVGALLGLTYLWLLTQHFPPPQDARLGPMAQMAGTPGFARWSWLVLVLLVAPPLEEFLFRGVLFTGVARSWGVPAATGVVTVLFVGLHLPEVGGYWPAMAAITSVGIATLIARIQSRSLGPAVALHGAYNLIIVLGLIVPRGL